MLSRKFLNSAAAAFAVAIAAAVLLGLAAPARAVFTGGPSVRVTPNDEFAIRWIADFVGNGRVDLFANADGTGLIDAKTTTSALDHTVEFFVGGILTPDTTYYFKVTHTDPTGARADLTNEPPPFPPVFTGVQAISGVSVVPGTNSALISWEANVIGLGQVQYNTEPDPGTIGPPPVFTMSDTLNITDHSIELTGLVPNTTYLFTVSNLHAIDGGTLAEASGSFTTIAEPSGDFNQDGTVDAADYVLWRKNDGTQPGYDTWRANFGESLGSGTGATGSASAAVPEPTSRLIVIAGMLAIFFRRRAAVVSAAALALCGVQPLSAAQFYLTGTPSSKSLSMTPESGSFYQESWTSGSRSWSNSMGLSADISGTSYEFHIYAASAGTTSFGADILVNSQFVATTSFSATSTIFLPKTSVVTGIDPTLTGTASLELRITHFGGSLGSILWGDTGGDTSFIRVPDPGDYNGDGTVDAADYVVWRKTDGTQAGYDTWRANFGATAGSGSGESHPANAAIPEPTSLLLVFLAAAFGLPRRPRRRVSPIEDSPWRKLATAPTPCFWPPLLLG